MIGRMGGAARIVGEDLGRRASTCQRDFFKEGSERAPFLLRIRGSVTDHQPLAAPELLPLRQMQFDPYRIELSACRHR
jgi:hypothetical protein